MDPQPMPPDKRCCYFLTLRKGSIIIGFIDITVNVIVFSFYTVAWLNSAGETTNMDVGYFVIFGLQHPCNVLLIFAALKKLPAFTLPWLTMNVGLIIIFLVLILYIIFVGSIQITLTNDKVSISPTFYEQLFFTKAFSAAFFLLRARFVFFWRK